MGLSIQTNVSSMTALDHLRVNNDFQSRTIERLTSGFRINASGDDAAGLAVANSYRSDVAMLTQGVRNANDGVSTLQIIDGGLSNITKMLDRLNTLATQAASGTFTGSRATLNNEFTKLLTEIDRQASNIGLNAASANAAEKVNVANLSVYIGGNVPTVGVDLSAGGVDSTTLALNGVTINGTVADPTGEGVAALALIKTALASVGTVQGAVGTGQNELAYAINLAQSQIVSFSAAESRIRDADIATEASNLTKAQVLQQSSMAALAQANSMPQSVLALFR
jgi:flagellin